MKIPRDRNQALKHVEIKNRVFIYDATIIIEFLNKTFMPLNYHIKREIIPQVGSGFEIKKEHLKEPERFDELFTQYRLSQIYDFYKMFRNQVDYTAPVETAFKFNIIMRKLIFSKNGWQFKIRRVGRAQLWYLGPLELRSKVSAEVKAEYPVLKKEVQTVEMTPGDLNEIEEYEEENLEVDFDENNEEVIVEKRIDEDELFPEEKIPVGPEKFQVSGSQGSPITNENFIGPQPMAQNEEPIGSTGYSGPSNDPTLA